MRGSEMKPTAPGRCMPGQRFERSILAGDVPGAVIAVEAEDLGAARAAVATLPLAIHEMMDVELIPMLPYRGFV